MAAVEVAEAGPKNKNVPTVAIMDAEGTEGDAGAITLRFTVQLSQVMTENVSVEYATSDAAAEAGTDYVASNGVAEILQGDTTTFVEVEVLGDSQIEFDEGFVVNLFNASKGLKIADEEAFGTIRNDDFPKLSLGPANNFEGDSGNRALAFPLTLDAPALEDLKVTYETVDGTARAGEDYEAKLATKKIPAGTTTSSFGITLFGDTDVEATETLVVQIIDLEGPAQVQVDRATGGILDDDGAADRPQITVFDTSVLETNSGTTELEFEVFLDPVLPFDVSFDYATLDGSAVAPDDYVAAAGSGTILANQNKTTIPIIIHGDLDEEDNESFFLQVTNVPQDVLLLTPEATGTIVDDDRDPPDQRQVSILSAAIDEGDTGTKDLEFEVLVSPAPTDLIELDYASEDVTATAGVDYDAVSGTLKFQAGVTTRKIRVPVHGDTFTEDDERLQIRLSNLVGDAVFDNTLATGTIRTEEPVTRISLSSDVVIEGNVGDQVEAMFTIALDVASVSEVTVDFATSDSTAKAGQDYQATNETVRIPAGDLQATVTVTIISDDDSEFDEKFLVTLTNLSPNARFSNADGTGSIVNDDGGNSGWQGPEHLDTLGDRPSIANWRRPSCCCVLLGQLQRRDSRARSAGSVVARKPMVNAHHYW